MFTQELFDHFKLVQLIPDSKRLDIYLDKKDLYPDGYDKSDVNTQRLDLGTYIPDFPLKEKATSQVGIQFLSVQSAPLLDSVFKIGRSVWSYTFFSQIKNCSFN